jgi:putative transposase
VRRSSPRTFSFENSLLFSKSVVQNRAERPVLSGLWLVALARFFDWQDALVIVQPATFVNWHRTAFRSFWRWKSRLRGRPSLPKSLRELVRQMDRDNPTWGEERIANELLLKLGIKVAARTVGKYLKPNRPRGRDHGQRWSTFVGNHAQGIVACDFFVSITASFRVLYVFVAMEVGSRASSALQRDATSQCGVDRPAVPRVPGV